jgi:hypothetical protein
MHWVPKKLKWSISQCHSAVCSAVQLTVMGEPKMPFQGYNKNPLFSMWYKSLLCKIPRWTSFLCRINLDSLRFSRWCCSLLSQTIIPPVVPDDPKVHSAFIFKMMQSSNSTTQSSWTAWPWRWLHYKPSKHRQWLLQWHCITSQKTWIWYGLTSASPRILETPTLCVVQTDCLKKSQKYELSAQWKQKCHSYTTGITYLENSDCSGNAQETITVPCIEHTMCTAVLVVHRE